MTKALITDGGIAAPGTSTRPTYRARSPAYEGRRRKRVEKAVAYARKRGSNKTAARWRGCS